VGVVIHVWCNPVTSDNIKIHISAKWAVVGSRSPYRVNESCTDVLNICFNMLLRYMRQQLWQM